MLLKVDTVKHLIQLMEGSQKQQTNLRSISAIICSSYAVNTEGLSRIPDKIVLSFDDITNEKSERSFNRNLAHQIKFFIDGLNPKALLYICCDSGQSRSAAIAAATYRYLHKDEMIIWKDPYLHPNRLVYRILCEAYGIKTTKLQILYRTIVNQMALRNAIKRSKNRTRLNLCLR